MNYKRLFLSLPLAFLNTSCGLEPPTGLMPPKDDLPVDKPENPPPPDDYAGNEDNTFDHMSGLGEDGNKDPMDVLAQRQDEGPPEVRTRLHSCQKIPVTTFRNILEGFGVDMTATGNPPTAGQLFSDGLGPLGTAVYDARVGETIVWTSSGAAKQFDILVQAAPEIIIAMPGLQQCSQNETGATLFDQNGFCSESGVTCLLGRPATQQHLAICTDLVNNASTPEKGKAIAVAVMLSAAHSCE